MIREGIGFFSALSLLLLIYFGQPNALVFGVALSLLGLTWWGSK